MCLVAGLLTWPASSATQPAASYAVVSAEFRRSLTARPVRGVDMASLDQIGAVFGFKAVEDPAVGGLTIDTRGRRILLIADQSFAQVDGRVRTLSAPVTKERSGWQVPLDFVSDALATVLGTRIEVRRASKLIVVGDLRIPQVSGRIDRTDDAARIALTVTPNTPARVTRDGNLLRIRFDAHSLDMGAITGAVPGFVTGTRVEGPTITFALGPRADSWRQDGVPGEIEIELLPPGATPPAPAPAAPAPAAPRPQPAPPQIDMTPPGTLRTIVIDAGHGGDDTGVVAPGGLTEKDLTLRVARLLKAGIESRIGVRVLLTRESDEAVSPDARSAAANHNKADLFISLHANGAPVAAVRGTQVITVNGADYRSRVPRGGFPGQAVPAVGAGLRTIEAVPWELAHWPYVERSAAFANILIKHLAARAVTLATPASEPLPLRVLVGTNMPAVLVELGFLSNPEEAAALAGAPYPAAIVEALVAAIADVRGGIPQ